MVIGPRDLPFNQDQVFLPSLKNAASLGLGERAVWVRREQGQKEGRGTETPQEDCTNSELGSCEAEVTAASTS